MRVMSETLPKRRTIRSFVMRQGRMTRGQQQALTQQWPCYGVSVNQEPFDFSVMFQRQAPCVVEIGFGMGDSLVTMAKENPHVNYLGIEVHPPGVGRCLRLLAAAALTNLKVCQDDALQVFEQAIADQSLAGIQIFFPDPWHKKKHHKRRLLNVDTMALFCQKLAPGGFLHIATDWADYATHISELLAATPVLQQQASLTLSRPVTKFERRGTRLGHQVTDFYYTRHQADVNS